MKPITSITSRLFPGVLALTLIVTSTTASAGPGDAGKSVYKFGGNCISQGAWSDAASEVSDGIRKALQQLQDDPNCSGLVKSFTHIDMPADKAKEASEKQTNAEANRGNLAATTGMAMNMSTGAPFLPVMLSSLLNGAAWDLMFGSTESREGRNRMAAVGVQSIKNFFSSASLPQYQNCLINRPELGAMVTANAVKMLAAYSSSGESNFSGLGDAISAFASFVRDQRFAKVINKLDQVDLAMSMSCLAESASETYCKAKDARELIRIAEQGRDNEVKHDKAQDTQINDPTEGYFILTREIPVVSSWMQKVMFGVQPRTQSDADFKMKVLDNVNNFLKSYNQALGAYERNALNYKNQIDPAGKKNVIFQAVKELSGILSNGGGGLGDVNFFDQAEQTFKIPFFLIGMSELPSAVLPNDKGGYVMGAWEWLQNGGNYQAPFNDPDALLVVIKERLDDLLLRANGKASLYFQQQLIVDTDNLVDQSLASSTISVYEAFVNIHDYLTKLIDRAESGTAKPEMGILPNLVRTRNNVKNVLDTYQQLFYATRFQLDKFRYIDPRDKQRVKEEIEKEFLSKEFKERLTKVVETVYFNFNVMLQRDTFLLNRMSTFVSYDFSYYVRHPGLLEPKQRDLLIVSAQNLVETLHGAYKGNPSAVSLDLSHAQNKNLNNIRSIELFFRDKMMANIAKLKLIVEGQGNSYITQKWDAAKRWFFDSLPDDYKKKSSAAADYDAYDTWFKRNWDYVKNPFNMVGLGVFNPYNLIYRAFVNKERYEVFDPIFEAAPVEQDDIYGSIAQVRALYCLQTLQFSNYYEFHDLCKGTVLKAAITDNRALDQEYDKLYQSYIKAGYASASGDKEALRRYRVGLDDNICALRDYRRKNHVEWLTKQMGKKGQSGTRRYDKANAEDDTSEEATRNRVDEAFSTLQK